MSRADQLKWTGVAFIVGALAFITILTASDPIDIPGSAISGILLALGLSGLRVLYGGQGGSLGRTLVPQATIAVVFLCLPLGILGVTGRVYLMNYGLWVLLFGAPVIPLIGLTWFGLAALRSRPMPRLNWLPLAAGIWYPLAYFSFSGYISTHSWRNPEQFYPELEIIFLMQFVALCALGTVLLADAARETAADPAGSLP